MSEEGGQMSGDGERRGTGDAEGVMSCATATHQLSCVAAAAAAAYLPTSSTMWPHPLC